MDAITTAISDSCEPVIIPDVYLQTIEDNAALDCRNQPWQTAALLYQVHGN